MTHTVLVAFAYFSQLSKDVYIQAAAWMSLGVCVFDDWILVQNDFIWKNSHTFSHTPVSYRG